MSRPLSSALFVIALMIAPQFAGAAVRAQVDPPVVDEMETVRLTLRTDGSNQAQSLDLSALERDFEVLGTNTSSQFQSINGQVQSWVEYQVNLRPKRAGTLEIPAIAIAGQRSRPLKVTVRPLAPEVKQAIDRMVFFEVDVSPNPVYVQAQALMTRRLYYASGVQIYSDLPGVPDIQNAVVLPLGETRSTTEVRPEGRYGVLEQRYAIFPERSGSLLVPEISVTSSVRIQSSGRTRRSGIRVSTPELRFDVLGVPASYPADQPWLPARQVSIRDVWERGNLTFDLGQPVRRTLTIEAIGNTGSSIPPVELSLPENLLKQYPEPVQINEHATAAEAEVVGTREQPYSIVPVAPGAARLPELRLTWWDTANERVRVATAAAETVRIAGDPLTSPETSAASAPVETRPEPTATESRPTADDFTAYPVWLVALTLFAFAGWAVTWLTMRRNNSTQQPQPAASRTEDSWKALAAACRQGDAKTMRDAWIRHLGACWNTTPGRTATIIRRHDDGQRLLDRLNRGLYSPNATEPVDGKEIIDATRALQKPPAGARSASLPELNART